MTGNIMTSHMYFKPLKAEELYAWSIYWGRYSLDGVFIKDAWSDYREEDHPMIWLPP